MRTWIPITLLSLLLAGSASALPSISLDQPVPEPAEGECPLLTRIKYPWLECRTTADGGRAIATATVAPNATWDGDKRIPAGHEFVDGQGGWKGPVD